MAVTQLILLVTCITISTCKFPDDHPGSWEVKNLVAYSHPTHSHESILDPAEVMTVFWTPDLENETVTWEIHARTRGWIGFGFSSNGGMAGADIVTAWVTDGKLHLQDRHGIGNTFPPVDAHQDWLPLHAKENDTHTIIVMSRAINTCDLQDFILTNETIRLIYAYGDEDPASSDALPYHGSNRGARVALVLLPFHQPTPPQDAKVWQVRQTRTLPNDMDTFYWCHIEKVPNWKTKQHYIGFQMVYGNNARSHMHHAVAFECHTVDGSATEDIFEKHVGQDGHECYTPAMPEEFYMCERFLINWAIGSEGEMLPDHVGFPMGDEHGGATYLLFQTHYDNPGLIPDVTVSWGMDLLYTDRIRSEDASILSLGHSIVFSLTIPSNVPRWDVSGHCSPACTFKAIPKEGIKVFTVFLHGHYLAKVIRLRHYRHGKELPPIAQDRYFDPDFQQSRRLASEVIVYPGDHLIVECEYNSTTKDINTYSGWKAKDEMCQAFLNYYPRMEMALCRSSPELKSLTTALGIPSFSKKPNLYDFIFDPELVGGDKYQATVNKIDWKNRDVKQINEAIKYGPHEMKCQYNNGDYMKIFPNITKYPENVKPFVKFDVCQLKKNNPQIKIISPNMNGVEYSTGTSVASSNLCIFLYSSFVYAFMKSFL